MSEGLLLCPFCGGEASKRLFYGVKHGIYCDECSARVGGLYDTEAEAIAAWNSRADTEYGSVPATDENMAKYGWVRERTCKEFGSVRVWQSCNVWSHELSCGHEVDTLESEPPNYCPECGAKVVGK